MGTVDDIAVWFDLSDANIRTAFVGTRLSTIPLVFVCKG
jgi:hypothetical protein